MKPISEWTDAELQDYADDSDLGATMQGLAAEVSRMRPVVDAALAWHDSGGEWELCDDIHSAVDAYRSEENQ